MLTQALIIDEPWIGHIMAGRKTWEMRSRRTTKRGPVALVRKGSGQIVAIATIIDCLPALSVAQMAAAFDKHRIPQAKVEQTGYKWFIPWVLANVRVLDTPVPYRHPAGAVTWVDLAPDVQAAVASAGARSSSDASANRARSAGPVQHVHPRVATTSRHTTRSSNAHPAGPDRAGAALAARVLDDLRAGSHAIDVPQDAALTVSRRGNKLYIDAVWDDGRPDRPRSPSDWIDTLGAFAALGAMLCMVTCMIMMAVGIANWSMTFFHAFYALPPMIVCIFIASLTGHGDLLDSAFRGHDHSGKSR